MVVAYRWYYRWKTFCLYINGDDDGGGGGDVSREDVEEGDFEELKRSEMILYSSQWSP